MVDTFVYPRSAGDPAAESVRASFKRGGKDFSSVLGRVKGTLYLGRTSAGGVGKAIDLDNDGSDDVSFSESCGFILQLNDGKVLRAEADRPVKARIAGKDADALGLEVEPPQEVASQGVRAHFVPAGDAALELLEATTESSPIARFLAKRGPGLHHITLRVDDIADALARLKARGVRLVDETPREGAGGSLVAFVHPSSTHGVLLELKQVRA